MFIEDINPGGPLQHYTEEGQLVLSENTDDTPSSEIDSVDKQPLLSFYTAPEHNNISWPMSGEQSTSESSGKESKADTVQDCAREDLAESGNNICDELGTAAILHSKHCSTTKNKAGSSSSQGQGKSSPVLQRTYLIIVGNAITIDIHDKDEDSNDCSIFKGRHGSNVQGK